MTTPNHSKFIKWLKKIMIALVFLELAYLLLFNIVLNTSYAQKLANSIRPEKLQLQWESVWSPYPFKIHATKIVAQGTSGLMQWRANAQSISTTLSPFALMKKTIKVSQVELNDLTYIQEPASSDTVNMSTMQKEINQATIKEEFSGKETKTWGVALDGTIKISGNHTFKTAHLAGMVKGSLTAEVALEKRGAPLFVRNGKMDITNTTLRDKNGSEIVKNAQAKGRFEILEKALTATINLSSKNVKVEHNGLHLQSNPNLTIKLKMLTMPSLHADLSGSAIALTNTRLLDQNSSQPWDTKVMIEKGVVEFPLAQNNATDAFSQILKKHTIKDLLASAEGKIKLTGDISQLEWINLLLDRSLHPTLWGSGIINADLLIEKGLLANKSAASIRSDDLEVALLDYHFKGKGGLMIEKIAGGENPDIKYALAFDNATMRRQGEMESMIDTVVMKLERITKDISLGDIKKDETLHLQIVSAKVKKVSLYNQYFPKNSPFSFVDGSADLSADIILKPDDAKGYIKFLTHGLTMMVDDQSISARLSVDTHINSGAPAKMQFDISGTTIVLDQAKVAGTQSAYDGSDWNTTLALTQAEIVWKKPIRLKSNALLTIKDTRPIVAMVNNGLSKFSFITNALIVENLRGEASITMANNMLMIPSALVRSDKMSIGAKGVIGENIRNGLLYFKLQGLNALLELSDGKKRFDIFNAQSRFDNYVLPPSPLPSR